MAGLTTHVLDTTRGRPAAGVRIELFALNSEGSRTLVAQTVTNLDGRTDSPLVRPEDARVGRYELLFHVGPYFEANGAVVSDPPFLDVVPIRFAVADARAHYHVPLVVTPWSYSTYRGS